MFENDLILGENVVLEVEKGGEYQPYACAIDVSIETSVETRKVRTLGDGKWNKTRPRAFAYKISLNGLVIINGGEPHAMDLQEATAGGFYLNIRIKFDEPNSTLVKIFNGTVLITNSNLAGGASGFASGAFELEGFGAYELLDGVIGCDAIIGALNASQSTQDGHPSGTAQVSFSGVSGAARLEYSIDGGGRESIFLGGAPAGQFYIFGLSLGAHTIEVWPVCEDGDDGESVVDNFTLT